MKVWITKYALSNGIEEKDMEKYVSGGREYATKGMCFHLIGKDAHLTKSDALVAAETMRKKKIASLRTQIEKLELLSFKDAS